MSQKRRYFGTDGVRGPYGSEVMNEAMAWRLGMGAARFAKSHFGWQVTNVVIGRDTRASGPALESALACGLAAEGYVPISLGVVPTPAVSLAVRRGNVALGAVITASHNPAGDNGIKFFGPTGIKLTDGQELEIERLMPTPGDVPAWMGRPALVPGEALEPYIDAAAALLPADALRGWKIVLDTANGAACRASREVLSRLGADLVVLGGEPDGRNINAGVGSQHPEQMSSLVRRHGARVGIAHDGDADRCIVCDESGAVLDGDEILTMLALQAMRQQRLAKGLLVVTVQSNLGVDAAVAAAGGRVVRTPVGDRYVSERMQAEGATLGGESSGHVICAEVSPTGDGLVAALKVLEVMLATGRPLSELRRGLRKFPQETAAIAVKEKRPLEGLPAVQGAMRDCEAALGERGRILVRYSGTEPKLRLLVEGPDDATVRRNMDRLKAAVQADLEVVEEA